MSSLVGSQSHADGTVTKYRRSKKQGRRPAGLGKPRLYRLYDETEKKLEEIVGSPGESAGTDGAEAEYDKAALAALQKEEVAMVKADLECEEEHVEEVENKVALEYEQSFREENSALLSKVPKQ